MEISMKEESGAAAAAALNGPKVSDFAFSGAAERHFEAGEAAAAAAAAETNGQQAAASAVSLHPLKIFFYEAVAKQLLDDELNEVAVALCDAMHLRANPLLPPDLLFSVFRAAAFQPSQEAAAAAAAATAQQLLLGKAPAKEAPAAPAEGASHAAERAAAAAATAATEGAASTEGDIAADTAAAAATQEGAPTEQPPQQQQQQQQQQRQQRTWQPLRTRAVPPITEAEQQFVFNPYPSPEGSGGPQGGPPGGPPGGPQGGPLGGPLGPSLDPLGSEALISATVVCSVNIENACLSTACSSDMSVAAAGALDGSVRLLLLKQIENNRGPLEGPPGPLGPPGAPGAPGAPEGPSRLLHTHEGPVSSVAISPDSRICFSGSFDGTVKLFDISSTKNKPLGGPIGEQQQQLQQQQQQQQLQQQQQQLLLLLLLQRLKSLLKLYLV
ncbi:hypothetical protein, conserved [Eimeria tenella]|uniref:Cleavage stimulation factor 50 kDa subunit n=1 Tax=Eimeria tenella TaxID=5802 RepID=U6KI00_EIMTE|nr:hypothetical protein, conserved [Eimeria tenella]CDJ37665.1 hypothetical protein, conserved [Eimeria tenella]|eukprot:XP_013228503.1 hypothetical protein, conserved [Eimeria tenella]